MNARTILLIALALSGCGAPTPADELVVEYSLKIFADHTTASAHFEKHSRKGAYGIPLGDAQTISFAGTPLPMTSDDAPFHFNTTYGADVPAVTPGAAFVLHTPGLPDISTPARCCVFAPPQATQNGNQLVVTYAPQLSLQLTLWSQDGCVDTLQRDLDKTGTVTLELTSLNGPCNAELDLEELSFDSLRGAFDDGTLDYEMHVATPITLRP